MDARRSFARKSTGLTLAAVNWAGLIMCQVVGIIDGDIIRSDDSLFLGEFLANVTLENTHRNGLNQIPVGHRQSAKKQRIH